MNKGFIFTIAFTFGAAVGSVVTWQLLKNKYEQLARDEIDEVRGYYASKDKPEEFDSDTEETPVKNTSDISAEAWAKQHNAELRTEYSAMASKYLPDDEKKEEGGDKPMSRREPYVISPAEFGEIENYETMTLIYYNDGILADSDNNRIDDIESCIGYESLNHFGEYDDADDSVYVRNDDAMTDYEVLLDESNYADLEGID